MVCPTVCGYEGTAVLDEWMAAMALWTPFSKWVGRGLDGVFRSSRAAWAACSGVGDDRRGAAGTQALAVVFARPGVGY
jgi:hypothetical protein